MEPLLQAKIDRERRNLSAQLEVLLQPTAAVCVTVWQDPDMLDTALAASLAHMHGCSLVYGLDCDGRQVSSSVSPAGPARERRGQDLSVRPWMRAAPREDAFALSSVYLSQADHQPCLTAMHRVTDAAGRVMGCVAADFPLSVLPSVGEREIAAQGGWRQIRGDPAIRQNLFLQERIPSAMDCHLQAVHDTVIDLHARRGIFHAKLHYSSSRATLWLFDDPHNYRLHVLDEIIDPSVCLAYARCFYPSGARVPVGAIRRVYERFGTLRNADANVYLRSASLNIINGMVGLTFSCDGSHYMPYDDFLGRDESFWFGASSSAI